MADQLFDCIRFYQPTEDYRPITFPPPGPYWCSGYRCADDAAVIVAFLPPGVNHRDFWPEAEDAEVMQSGVPIEYSGRFPKPDWMP